MGVELYPHQQSAVKRLRNGCVLCGGVGSGKSLTAVAYYVEKEAPRDIYVITTAKKRDSLDWDREFARYGVGRDPEGSTAGQLFVSSWNNIERYKNVCNAFFVFDEQRLVGSGKWVKVFLKIARRNHWILLSATPGDTWLDYVPIFVANGFYSCRTEFKQEHVVYVPWSKFPKVSHYNGEQKLERLRAQILVEMPDTRHTTRVVHDVAVEYDRAKYREAAVKRWHVFQNRPTKTMAETFLVCRRIIVEDPTRLERVRGLMKIHPRLIVFYNFDSELAMLRSLCDSVGVREWRDERWTLDQNSSQNMIQTHSKENEKISRRPTTKSSIHPSSNTMQMDVTIAEWNGHKHEPIPDSERWVYLVQYTSGAEGWNCIETDAMVFYSLPYSYKLFEQAKGRIDRINTPFPVLHYYALVSSSPIDKAIVQALEQKKNFNSRDFSLDI